MNKQVMTLVVIALIGCSKQEHHHQQNFLGNGVVVKTTDVNGDFFTSAHTIVVFEMDERRYEASSRLFSEGDSVRVYQGLGSFYLR